MESSISDLTIVYETNPTDSIQLGSFARSQENPVAGHSSWVPREQEQVNTGQYRRDSEVFFSPFLQVPSVSGQIFHDIQPSSSGASSRTPSIQNTSDFQSSSNDSLTIDLNVHGGLQCSQVTADPVPDSKAWHSSVSIRSRHHFVRKLVMAILSVPDAQRLEGQRMLNLVTYARKLESDNYKIANSQIDYNDLMADIIQKVQNEFRDKRAKPTPQQQSPMTNGFPQPAVWGTPQQPSASSTSSSSYGSLVGSSSSMQHARFQQSWMMGQQQFTRQTSWPSNNIQSGGVTGSARNPSQQQEHQANDRLLNIEHDYDTSIVNEPIDASRTGPLYQQGRNSTLRFDIRPQQEEVVTLSVVSTAGQRVQQQNSSRAKFHVTLQQHNYPQSLTQPIGIQLMPDFSGVNYNDYHAQPATNQSRPIQQHNSTGQHRNSPHQQMMSNQHFRRHPRQQRAQATPPRNTQPKANRATTSSIPTNIAGPSGLLLEQNGAHERSEQRKRTRLHQEDFRQIFSRNADQIVQPKSAKKMKTKVKPSTSSSPSVSVIPECSICLDKLISTLVFPCKHFFCEDCAPKIHNCGICRKVIEQRHRVYF